MTENQICCPNCGQDIDVNDILYRKLDADLRKKYESQRNTERSRLQEQQVALQRQQQEIQAKEKSIEQSVAQQVEGAIQKRLTTERQAIIAAERARAEQSTADSIVQLQKELSEKSEQVKELNKTRADVSRLHREKDNMKAELEVQNEQKLNRQLAVEREKIAQIEANRNEMKLKEKEHVISQLKDQINVAQRKAEQGSMQTQGEVQELALEEWLRSQFPQDTIEEIKKGALGGDCIQTINTTGKLNRGTIYFESKRTKAFQPGWIEKFKADIRDRNCNIGVLVSQARPQGLERMGMVDGIWVCNFDEFKGLCQVLRSHIIQLDDAVLSEENKGDKMAMLYQYLQSNEFRMQVEAIVEGFTQMKTDLDKEKRSIQGHWKKREKQIDKVLLNTSFMYQSVRGIAGSSIQTVAALEFEG